MANNEQQPDVRVKAGIDAFPSPPGKITWRTLLLGVLGSLLLFVAISDLFVPRASRLLMAFVVFAVICLAVGGILLAAKIKRPLKQHELSSR